MGGEDAAGGPISRALGELAGIIARATAAGGSPARLGPIWAYRADAPTPPASAAYWPLACVVAQGRKRVVLGDEGHEYAAGDLLVNSVTVPATGRVVEASADRPCFWMVIRLDAALIGEVAAAIGGPPPGAGGPLRAMEAAPIDAPTLDAVVRLARLLEAPGEADFLLPLASRELAYRLLAGPQGPRLRQAAPGGRTLQVVRAVEWLRANYRRPMTIAALARECGLGPSALHRHFRALTASTPLRFQAQLRLQEARRLMAEEGFDAAEAGYRVGYDDPAYFSRAYRRFFGDPPRRHLARGRVGPEAAGPPDPPPDPRPAVAR